METLYMLFLIIKKIHNLSNEVFFIGYMNLHYKQEMKIHLVTFKTHIVLHLKGVLHTNAIQLL